MSVESLTYADLADRLGTTQEAARSLVRRLRLPRQTGNDGRVRINIDLAEIQYKPLAARSPGGHQQDMENLKAQIAALQVELTGSNPRTVRSERVRPVTGPTSSASAIDATISWPRL